MSDDATTDTDTSGDTEATPTADAGNDEADTAPRRYSEEELEAAKKEAPGDYKYGSDDGQDYVDRTNLDFDPEDGLYAGTAVDGTSDIPNPEEALADSDGDTDTDSSSADRGHDRPMPGPGDAGS